MRRTFVFAVVGMLAGCSGAGSSSVDADVIEDASPSIDAAGAGTLDAGAMDAAQDADAARVDGAVAEDATVVADAIVAADATVLADATVAADAEADAGCVVIGEAESTASSDMLDLFGTPSYFNGGADLPAGTYRVHYVDGCMKYGAGQGWTVNAYAMDYACWYVIGATTSDRFVVAPGNVGYAEGAGAFASFEDCEAASRAVAPVEFELTTAGPVGVWLTDTPYSDNSAGEGGRNPRWTIERVAGACATE